MSDGIVFSIDGRQISGRPGDTVLEAAQTAGVWIPRLCAKEGLSSFGSCRVCTVKANGRFGAACTTPIAPGMIVENETPEILRLRRDLIDMLFVEGNHFCMFCEKSGGCELQALAYRFGIAAPRFPYQFPDRSVDASHPDVLLDRNRCVLCARCVRASREVDRKSALGFTGRGADKRVAPDTAEGLEATRIAAADAALAACPTGALVRKRVGFAVPIGDRKYDPAPIGAAVEALAGAGDDNGAGSAGEIEGR